MTPIVVVLAIIGGIAVLCAGFIVLFAYLDEKEVMKGRQSQWK